MRIEQLEYLTAVTKYGSLRRASEQMHLSQPALSEAISSLEREFGVALLNRQRTGARISEDGKELLPRMKDVLDAVAQLKAAADERQRLGRVVRVGTVNAGTSSLLVPGILSYADLRGSAKVEVRGVVSTEVHAGLKDGTLDVGLVNVLPGDEIPEGLRAITLLQGYPVLVCRSADDLAELAEIRAADVAGRPFVAMREGYVMNRFARQWLGTGFEDNAVFTDGAENGKYLVAAGAGVTVLPEFSVAGDPLETAGVIVGRSLADVATKVTMLLVRRESVVVPDAIRQFEQNLVEVASKHPRGRWAGRWYGPGKPPLRG